MTIIMLARPLATCVVKRHVHFAVLLQLYTPGRGCGWSVTRVVRAAQVFRDLAERDEAATYERRHLYDGQDHRECENDEAYLPAEDDATQDGDGDADWHREPGTDTTLDEHDSLLLETRYGARIAAYYF